jgi:hypothetical protein
MSQADRTVNQPPSSAELFIHGVVLTSAVSVDIVAMTVEGDASSILHSALIAIQLMLAVRNAYRICSSKSKTREVLFAGWVSVAAIFILVGVDIIDLVTEAPEVTTMLSGVAGALHYTALRVEATARAEDYSRVYARNAGVVIGLALLDTATLFATLWWSSVEIVESVGDETLHYVVVSLFAASVVSYWAAATYLYLKTKPS